MSEEMIEKVARAIDPGAWKLIDLNRNCDGYRMSFLAKERADRSLAQARAAIAAYNPNERLREARNNGVREAAEWVAKNLVNNGVSASVAMLEELGLRGQ